MLSGKPFYFGAVGTPDVPDHITLWGLSLPICQGFDQYTSASNQNSARRHLTAAPSRPRKLLKVVTKSNAQRHGKYRRGDASDGGVY